MEAIETFIPAGARVYITDVGTHSSADMAAGCARLLRHSLIAVPHIAARRLSDMADLEDKIKRYAGAGVHDILVIGGSPDRKVGNISATMEVLETGLFDANGIKAIGIAGHPEGSPDFSDAVAAETLKLKLAFSERTDAKMRIVTQFGFDAKRFINWAEGVQQSGIDLPIHLGVAGPARITTLIKFAAMCGVGNSLSFLKKQATKVTTLAIGFSPESVVKPIEENFIANPDGPIRQIHVFPFGGAKKSAEWLAERGSWQIGASLENAVNG